MENPIAEFYTAFQDLESEKMVACYHDDILFVDPAFGALKGDRAKDMWRMLCDSQKGKDFKVVAKHIQLSQDRGSATWEAHYTFSGTGRRVHNIVKAEFELLDGKILKHTDSFDLYAWARQAMGMKGLLFGWTPVFSYKLKERTNTLLTRYQDSHRA
ncbi:MAG: nuclear transport factor 2 family protein [Sediminicola sp.]|tara:strand:- start:26610 stop:27080 length:471 start_codon:yes stop_codon:yes gene_type:complete